MKFKQLVQNINLVVLMILFLTTGTACDANAEKLPCGRYDSDGGMYDALIFGDNLEVTVEAAGLSEKTTYLLQDGKVRLRNGITLKMLNSVVLEGLEWTKGHLYERKTQSDKECSVSSNEQMSMESCYWKAEDLRAQGELNQAAQVYLNCCDLGDAQSCNVYGVLEQLLENDRERAVRYYTKACEMGYGGGCSNLAQNELRAGQQERAIELFQEGCDKGHMDSCVKAWELSQ